MVAARGALAGVTAAACASGSDALVVEKLRGATGLKIRSQPSKTNTEFQTLPLVDPIA